MTSTALAFEAAVCCACGHRAADPFITAEDDLTGRPGRFTFRRCRACGLVDQTPRLTIERVKDYYYDDYLAHRQRSDWGWMSPFFHWALGSIDREKLRICSRFGDRWPGLQAPQHTALYDRTALLKLVERADLEVVDYLPYGAFPPYFYFFCGVAFRVSKGRGLNMGRAIYPYFAGQPGAVHVHLKKAIDTSRWRLDDLVSNTHAVRRRFIQWHHEHRGEEPVRAGRRTPVAAAAAS